MKFLTKHAILFVPKTNERQHTPFEAKDQTIGRRGGGEGGDEDEERKKETIISVSCIIHATVGECRHFGRGNSAKAQSTNVVLVDNLS